MLDLDQLIASACAEATPLTPERARQVEAESKRASATVACRQRKTDEKNKALDSVNGDRESLCRIHLWEPRTRTDQMMFSALDRRLKSEVGNEDRAAMIDLLVDCESTEYVLTEHIIPRARHPDEEVAFAKLQGRFREHKPSIQGFFHKPTNKSGDRRARRVCPAPIGDFEWCERDEALTREQQINRSLAAMRAARPIRNVKEAC